MSPEEAYAAAVDASGAGVSAIFVTGDPAQMLRAALASLRASGYVVVPMTPTYKMAAYAEAVSDFYLYEGAKPVEGRCEEMLGALIVGIAHAPAFPPEAPDA